MSTEPALTTKPQKRARRAGESAANLAMRTGETQHCPHPQAGLLAAAWTAGRNGRKAELDELDAAVHKVGNIEHDNASQEFRVGSTVVSAGLTRFLIDLYQTRGQVVRVEDILGRTGEGGRGRRWHVVDIHAVAKMKKHADSKIKQEKRDNETRRLEFWRVRITHALGTGDDPALDKVIVALWRTAQRSGGVDSDFDPSRERDDLDG